jgi:nicotinamidase-related amidase
VHPVRATGRVRPPSVAQVLDVVGLAYSGCVKAAVESAVEEGFAVRVLTDCCADPPGHGRDEQIALDLQARGVIVITSDLIEQGVRT